jgi:hypothetical protein
MYRSSPVNPGDEAADVGSSLHGERSQLDRGDPPLRAILQRGDLVLAKVQADRLVEVGRHLVRGEAQVGSADLDELAAGA